MQVADPVGNPQRLPEMHVAITEQAVGVGDQGIEIVTPRVALGRVDKVG